MRRSPASLRCGARWRICCHRWRTRLPGPGERVAIVGCGTSYFIAQAIAAARESAGCGETDAFVASEMPAERLYDLVLAISRSGTTTEVVRCLQALPAGVRSLAISAVPGTPVVEAARRRDRPGLRR